ncbi:MAG: amidase, partial [Rhodococcus sp. (in: high G+C Gram-positive bacteria)]
MVRSFSRRKFMGVAATGGAGIALARNTTARAQSADSLPPIDAVSVTDPALFSAVEAASLLQAGELHPKEVVDACLNRSRALDGDIGAWIRIYPEVAYAAAEAAGQRLSQAARAQYGQPDLVCGIPIALKDIYAVAGLPLTASSRVLDGNVAASHSGVWRRLELSGMVLLGHAHTDEFAIGVTTPQVGNPWNTSYSPGGSSGGSAAVVAARFAPLATGSDTGGSIRIPASACGISSIKPTFGRCSTSGMIPLTWTRDHAGPMGRSLADASLLLTYMSGVDEADPTTRASPDEKFPLAPSGRPRALADMRVGVPSDAFDNLPTSIGSLMTTAIDTAKSLGVEVVT